MTTRIFQLGMIAALALSLNACRDRSFQEVSYKANVPIYLPHEILRVSIGSEEPKELRAPGKIHRNGDRLYIVDWLKGVHVFDNSNPSSPKNFAYINIPGVVDISTSGNILYADSYIDLVTVDVTDPTAAFEVDRDADVFIQVLPPTKNEYPIADVDLEKGVVVGWEIQTITEEEEIQGGPVFWRDDVIFTSDFNSVGQSESGGVTPLSSPPNQSGQSGSMARFTLVGDYLYTVYKTEMRVFSLADRMNPSVGAAIEVNREMETIFPMDDHLFIGTTTGMLIYELSNPANPGFLSNFNHVASCDPVVVQNGFAYVTLRSGTPCAGWTNQLDVLDVSNLSQPELIRSYPLTNPHGLGIDDNVLFICDGSDGLKVYDATDKMAIDQNMLAHFPSIQSYDVIPYNDVLMMIGDDGFFQYDYEDPKNIKLLSQIPVVK